MNFLDDLKYNILEFWNEFRKVKSGIIGLGLIILFLLVIIFEKQLTPYTEANSKWRDIKYWEDNAKAAKPVWVNLFAKDKLPETKTYTDIKIEETKRKKLRIINAELEFDHNYIFSPSDFVIHADVEGKVVFSAELIRPDEKKVKLYKNSFNYESPTHVRISAKNDAIDGAYRLASDIDYENTSQIDKSTIDSVNLIFSKAKEKMIGESEILQGKYKLKIKYVLPKESSKLENIKVISIGKVSGLMGTDNFKRDIFSGLIGGMKWAILIGLLTSTISVSIGVIYGITSAYFGGIVDRIMQRILEFFINIPFLPLLIVMGAVFKPSIWTLIFMMCALNWTGSVRTVRSIGLQIKEETYIEATKALGAGHLRIIFNHMVPLLIPYSFASMALSVPAAILTEAGMSILGLGDATIITWGQMLQDAMRSGAVIQGLWWWIAPPGLMISMVGMSFAFLGFSLDKILMPKLRTR